MEVCTHGCRTFVEQVGRFLKPKEECGILKSPKEMVDDGHWADVCRGLVSSGLCGYIEREDVFAVNDRPLLNGMFGVTKDEYTDSGAEIFRLIMNLIPFNQISQPMTGDVKALPTWSMMSPFFLQPSECLLISSEDVKCFFYTMRVPSTWWKFLAFNKPVPDCALPPELCGKVYLDNYDLLEKVSSTEMVEKVGTLSPGILALRSQYEVWDIPRNTKKAVQRSALCEMQGAMVNGAEGIAYPREVKLAKYFSMAYHLMDQVSGTQKQWQVVCGGLVYMTICSVDRCWVA